MTFFIPKRWFDLLNYSLVLKKFHINLKDHDDFLIMIMINRVNKEACQIDLKEASKFKKDLLAELKAKQEKEEAEKKELLKKLKLEEDQNK